MLQLKGQLGLLYGLRAAVCSTEREWTRITHATLIFGRARGKYHNSWNTLEEAPPNQSRLVYDPERSVGVLHARECERSR